MWIKPPALPAPYPRWSTSLNSFGWYFFHGSDGSFADALFARMHHDGTIDLHRGSVVICRTADEAEFVQAAMSQLLAIRLGLVDG